MNPVIAMQGNKSTCIYNAARYSGCKSRTGRSHMCLRNFISQDLRSTVNNVRLDATHEDRVPSVIFTLTVNAL